MRVVRIQYRWELVILLWAAFFLNQADRQVYSVVLPGIQAELGLSHVQAGLIASIFTAAMGLMVPFAGFAADALSKKWVISLSLLAWSVSTLLTGFGTGLLHLVVVRSLATAVGESFYAPTASALIGEYHESSRALALSIHQSSVYSGVVASGLLAGYLADRFGWRTSFWVFGAGGIVLAVVLAWRLEDSPASATSRQSITVGAALRAVFRARTVLMLGAAFAGMVFVNIGYLTWMPTYLHERFHLSLSSAGFSSMFYHHAFALLGVIVGGRLSDRYVIQRPRVRLEIQAAGLFLGVPFLCYLGLANSLPAVLVALSGFGFCRGLYDSNTYAALYDAIAPKYRGSAAALVIAFGFIVGAFAPVLLGYVGHKLGLAFGFSVLSLFYLAGAAAIVLGAFKSAAHDRALAMT